MSENHTWAKIEHHGKPLWVSLDALKVDAVRRRFTYAEAKVKAEELGGRLPAPAELDSRWRAAGMHNLPHPLDYRTKGDEKHSALIEKDLADYEREYGEPYEWIIGNCGKHWCDYPMGSSKAKPLYGWFVDLHTRRLAPAPVHPSETLPDSWVIQRPWDSNHNAHHHDYSMTGVFVRDSPPPEWCEIDSEGYVKRVRFSGPTRVASWLDPSLQPRERCLSWSLSKVGLVEVPLGSNTHPDIVLWAKRCTRDSVGGMGSLWNAKQGADWCAVFATGGAHAETALPGDPGLPCGMRVSGKELEDDAKQRGCYVAPELVYNGRYELQSGDLLIWYRYDPGTTNLGWRRHVSRFVEWANKAAWVPRTVDGNKGHAVRLVDDRPLKGVYGQPPLSCVIRYPGNVVEEEDETPTLRNDSAALLEGIDISHHQAPASLPWVRIGRDFRFVMVRACYGLSPDRYFVEHVRQARAHGLAVGAYVFVRQTQSAEAQLATLLDQMQRAGMDVGDICPAIDLEDNRANGDGPIDARLEQVGRKMSDELRLRFGSCITYTERAFWEEMGSPTWVLERPVWTSWPRAISEDPWPRGQWAIWQHHHGRGATYPDALDQNTARHLPRIRA